MTTKTAETIIRELAARHGLPFSARRWTIGPMMPPGFPATMVLLMKSGAGRCLTASAGR
jgi:hypothetical protein